MRRMKVLSVDFDYFQNVDLETMMNYPDGHDFGIELSKIIWSGHYANPYTSEKLLKVDVDVDKIEHMKRIIRDSYVPGKKVLICNSHKNIYEFILDEFEAEDFDSVDIYNVDMHHDMFNDNESVDCGNWVSHILNKVKDSTITWIANPISLDAYGMDRERFSMVSKDLGELDFVNFDIIFLCRSDIWTPPHLDSYFIDLSYDIIETYGDVYVEKKVLEIRDCSELIAQTRELYKGVKEC